MWELQFNGKGVENFTGAVLKFKFVSIFIDLKNLEDLSIDIKIFVVISSFSGFKS